MCVGGGFVTLARRGRLLAFLVRLEAVCAVSPGHPPTLYNRYVQQGKMPAYKLGEGGALRFKQADLLAFLTELRRWSGLMSWPLNKRLG